MPFRTFTWEDGELKLGNKTPHPELRQIDKDTFKILKSFCYQAPDGDPDEGDVFVVPGEDFQPPSPPVSVHEAGVLRDVVIPPDTDGESDLASVPPIFWWLIASYGNHTRASLLHDALYVDEGEPPVPRRTADRLFLGALRESPQKAGHFRHWLMWAAVSAFGTMRYLRGGLFAAHVLAVWALTISGVVWAWGDRILSVSSTEWQIALAIVFGIAYLMLLGASWRAGVDVPRGWIVPLVLSSLLILVPLASEWTYPFELELSPFTLLVTAAALMLIGPLWGFFVDPTLRGWLWPTAVIGLPIAMIPFGLIVAATFLVWLIDLGASIALAFRRKAAGKDFEIDVPTFEPTRARP
jgi:hypothetical protein